MIKTILSTIITEECEYVCKIRNVAFLLRKYIFIKWQLNVIYTFVPICSYKLYFKTKILQPMHYVFILQIHKKIKAY